MPIPRAYRGLMLPFFLVGCQPNDKGVLDSGETGETGETGSIAPLFEGPFSYDSVADDKHLIDTLWMVTEQAVEEIAAGGETAEEYLSWRIDALNDTLVRSLVDSSRLRDLGVHVVTTDDEDRTGVSIGQTDVNISTALTWLYCACAKRCRRKLTDAQYFDEPSTKGTTPLDHYFTLCRRQG